MSFEISVIIPIYNVENYLKTCLDSIVNQTLGIDKIEVIIVNDCTPDNSMELVREYSEKYPSFKIIELDSNQGLGNARNIGLKYVTSDYVTFVDSDDYISLNAYENSLKKMKSNQCDLLAYNSQIFSDNSNEAKYDIHQLKIDEDIILDDLNQYSKLIFSTSAWNKIFSKNLIDFLDFPNKLYEDNYAIVLTLFNTKKIYLNSESTYFYRKNEDKISITTDINLKNCMDLSDSIINLFTLENEYSKYSGLLKLLNLKFTNDIIFWLFDKISFFNEENEILEKIRPFADKFTKEDMILLKKLVPYQVNYDDFILDMKKYNNEFLLGKYKYFDNLPYLDSKTDLYIDTGSDFNENEKISLNYQLKRINTLKFDLSSFKNIKRLRFDPVKNELIKCKMFSVKTDNGNLTYLSNSNDIRDNFVYFSDLNPYYLLEGDLEDVSFVLIEFTLNFLTKYELNLLLNNKDEIINNKNEKIKYLKEELNK